MVGVGDASLARTRERIRIVNKHAVNGVVVLSPFLWKFSQAELAEYFVSLADASRHPLFLYDLPILTGTKLEMDTVLRVAQHPNVHGIKCSCALEWTQELLKAAPDGFRVIVAQADQVDALARQGVAEQLDGVFSIAPHWVTDIQAAAAVEDWHAAAAAQRRLSALLKLVKQYGVFQSMTTLLNARGIPGNFAPAPMRRLTDDERSALLAEPIAEELLGSAARVGSTS
jgi:4-hydroxy-tetrahydrodipicolinate synthase